MTSGGQLKKSGDAQILKRGSTRKSTPRLSRIVCAVVVGTLLMFDQYSSWSLVFPSTCWLMGFRIAFLDYVDYRNRLKFKYVHSEAEETILKVSIKVLEKEGIKCLENSNSSSSNIDLRTTFPESFPNCGYPACDSVNAKYCLLLLLVHVQFRRFIMENFQTWRKIYEIIRIF